MRLSISIAFISILLLNSCNKNPEPPVSVSQLKCNWLENPIGTNQIPDFNWILKSDLREQIQTAYQIIISSDKGIGDIWNSGKIQSKSSAWISYNGTALLPEKEYFWKVRVWDG